MSKSKPGVNVMSGNLKIEETIARDTPSGAKERVTIPVTGMTCAACQSFIQRTLVDQAGVQGASVNLMLNNATVTFDPGVTSASALVDTTRGTGYGAEIPLRDSSVLEAQEANDAGQLREYKQ